MITEVLCVAAFLATAPAEGQARAVVLDECRYASDAAARAAWRPIEAGSPPVAAPAGGGLLLPGNFTTNDAWRVGWDRRGRWDLSACQEVEVRLSSGQDAPARMILYLRSGEGWYGAHFDAAPAERSVTIPRKAFNIEGAPTGWDRIETVRLSVLRDEAVDRTVLVRAIRGLTRPAPVAIYRNDAGIGRESSVPRHARIVADCLDRLGLAYEILDDRAVAAGGLAGKQVAILPLNPVLPAAAGEALRKFVAGGGRLIAAYCLPEPLGELLGVTATGAVDGRGGRLAAIQFQGREDRSKITARQFSWWATRFTPRAGTKIVGQWLDETGQPSLPAVTRGPSGYFIGHVLTDHDPYAKDRLLLEMLGQLWYGAWKEVYAGRLARLGQAAGLDGMKELSAAVRAGAAGNPRGPAALKLLAEGEALAREGASVMKYGDAVVAAETLARAQRACLEAYATSVPSRPDEFRAVWCHDPAGLRGRSWDQAAKTLADAGFNAVIPNMLWGGGAAYPSKVLPAIAEAASRDLLTECAKAAKAHGIAVHVWKVNWNLWSNCPKAFRDELRQAGRLQQDFRGNTIDWLCPSDEANQRLELDSMIEVASNYDVAGIHFDYIRYPGEQSCYCPRCRAGFEAAEKVKVADWPADVRSGPLRARYLQFRRDGITRLVAAVSRQARKIKPKVLISAAVFPNAPSARDQVGQDWRLWVEKGHLDFVCPMQYTQSDVSFDYQTRSSVGWAGGRAGVMPGIGATLGLMPDGTLRQVLLARQRKAGGFVLFNFDRTLTEEHLPLLRMGATAEPTAWAPSRSPDGATAKPVQ